MPQPLSSFRRATSIIPKSEAAIQRPTHAAKIAACLAAHAECEALLGAMLIHMLGANSHVALTMYEALTGSQPKDAAMKAAANTILDWRDRTILNEVLAVTKTAASDRNRFAHWVWAYSDELPDHIMFVDPSEIAAQRKRFLLVGRIGGNGILTSDDHLRLSSKRILVYSLDDINEAHLAISTATLTIHMFLLLIMQTGAARAQERKSLLNWLQKVARPKNLRKRPRAGTCRQAQQR